ncbi:DUF3316 domain-containing protein [Vibrio tapetis subsp. quintayensis]|uniref:DUF3316 domain-containing protein n=1 Tax=Vibrio tapetis TaxID=52443 RepID=UPI0025B559C7|nr:DUF3316 domain-containing protein [Vibrio tapetis]MDN3680313.1 DUF3316 domain-containing protein [Vibrio tapetis subsp. quintayensis]
MNKLLTAIIATVALSSSAFAASNISHTHLTTDSFGSKNQAYEAGFDLANSLGDLSSNELSMDFRVSNAKNISVDDYEVSIEEFAVDRDNIEYRAVVDVKYSFDDLRNDS